VRRGRWQQRRTELLHDGERPGARLRARLHRHPPQQIHSRRHEHDKIQGEGQVQRKAHRAVERALELGQRERARLERAADRAAQRLLLPNI
jgi:hypothetical protein